MASNRHYKNAPIENALIDVQVEAGTFCDLALLAAPPLPIREKYPESSPVISGTAAISIGAASSASFQPSQVGYFRGSKTGPLGMQVRQDGLTVSRGRPYESWESLRTEFMEVWDWYKNVVNVVRIRRIGVRYTNRILLPQPVENFRDYFNTLPTIGDGLPGGLAAYAMQLQIPLGNSGDVAIFSQAMPPFTGGDGIPIILDIDVVRPVALPAAALPTALDELHAHENKFFEDSITDRTREIIS